MAEWKQCFPLVFVCSVFICLPGRETKIPFFRGNIRPCITYKEEFDECTSYKGRFHQKYVHGDVVNCSQWREDYNNCSAFIKTRDPNFALKVIESEKFRRKERIRNASNNDVWEYRTEPPKDWSRPLPTHLEQNRMPQLKQDTTFCSIM